MKVLCINDSDFKSSKIKNFPKAGEIYTLEFSRREPSGKLGYVLKEVRNPYFYCLRWGGEMVEPTFDSKRFIEWNEISIEENEYAEATA